jgi:RimJ/RimL family protein N-acetyltransferase
LEKEDLPALYEIEDDPEVKRYLNGRVEGTRDQWMAAMSKNCPSRFTLAVCMDSTAQFMGRAALHRSGGATVDLVIVLGRAWWRCGYGLEIASLLIRAAFQQMGASSVTAAAHPENLGSLSILQRFGFQAVPVLSSPPWQKGHVHHELSAAAYNAALCAESTL